MITRMHYLLLQNGLNTQERRLLNLAQAHLRNVLVYVNKETTKRTQITIINKFHNTETTLKAKSGTVLTAQQAKRIKKRLCPSESCCCSEVGSTQGQSEMINHHEIMLR